MAYEEVVALSIEVLLHTYQSSRIEVAKGVARKILELIERDADKNAKLVSFSEGFMSNTSKVALQTISH